LLEDKKVEIELDDGGDLKSTKVNPPTKEEQIKELLADILKDFNSLTIDKDEIKEENVKNIFDNIIKTTDPDDLQKINALKTKAIQENIDTEMRNELLGTSLYNQGNEDKLSDCKQLMAQNLYRYNQLKNGGEL
jgi:hypothetical protein